MKTAKERAIEIVQQMRTNMDIPKHLEDGLVGRITLALKDQDKITRHACAEAVLNLDDTDDAVDQDGLIDVYKAESVIMNTKAV